MTELSQLRKLVRQYLTVVMKEERRLGVLPVLEGEEKANEFHFTRTSKGIRETETIS
jgi:hypothetical protein